MEYEILKKKVFSRIDRNSIQYKKNGRLVQHF